MRRKLEGLGNLLRERQLTLATAESATGGLIAGRITDIAGSSDYFKGAVVAYANEVKSQVLGVARETLERHGAVSPQVAEEMAQGVRRLLEADVGLSDTGIAGPGGATLTKPVGLFYIGVSSAHGTKVQRHLFRGDRLQNRGRAVEAALRLLRRHLLSMPS